MNVNSLITKDYRKNDDFSVRINKPNSNPISVKAKMSANLFVTKDYENETTLRPQKTNPNKPNFTYPQRGKTEVRCRMLEVIYLSSAFCFLSSVHGHLPPFLAQIQGFTPKVIKKLEKLEFPNISGTF